MDVLPPSETMSAGVLRPCQPAQDRRATGKRGQATQCLGEHGSALCREVWLLGTHRASGPRSEPLCTPRMPELHLLRSWDLGPGDTCRSRWQTAAGGVGAPGTLMATASPRGCPRARRLSPAPAGGQVAPPGTAALPHASCQGSRHCSVLCVRRVSGHQEDASVLRGRIRLIVLGPSSSTWVICNPQNSLMGEGREGRRGQQWSRRPLGAAERQEAGPSCTSSPAPARPTTRI